MTEQSQVIQFLRGLFWFQQLAVFSTQDCGQPYTNLVAFTETHDLKQLLFVTKRNTRKYNNIKADSRAAMLIDNRTNQISDFQNAVAVTAIGIAEEVPAKDGDVVSKVFLRKHPHLRDFFDSPDSALISLKVDDYVIASFGEVKTIHAIDLC